MQTKPESVRARTASHFFTQRHIDVECHSHVHIICEAVIVTSGVLDMEIGGKKYEIPKGRGVFISSLEPHSFHSREHNTCRVIEFSRDLLTKAFPFAKDMEVKRREFSVSPTTEAIIDELLSGDGWYVDEVRFLAVLAPLAFDVRRDAEFSEHAYLKGDTLLRVFKYIDEHFTEAITLSSVASALGIHPVSVSRIISVGAGTTFNRHLQNTRCLFAERLIRQGNMTFAEISYEAGFGSIRSFNRVFFQVHRRTPTDYKRECERLLMKK